MPLARPRLVEQLKSPASSLTCEGTPLDNFTVDLVGSLLSHTISGREVKFFLGDCHRRTIRQLCYGVGFALRP